MVSTMAHTVQKNNKWSYVNSVIKQSIDEYVHCVNVDVVDTVAHKLFQEVLVKWWSTNTSLFPGHEGFCTQS